MTSRTDKIMTLVAKYRVLYDAGQQGGWNELRAEVQKLEDELVEETKRVIAAESGWNADVIELTERAEKAEAALAQQALAAITKADEDDALAQQEKK